MKKCSILDDALNFKSLNTEIELSPKLNGFLDWNEIWNEIQRESKTFSVAYVYNDVESSIADLMYTSFDLTRRIGFISFEHLTNSL